MMKIIYGVAAALALAAAATTASAQEPPNTGRPSYDMPRAYDRDVRGNEDYVYRPIPGPHKSSRHKKKKRHHRKHHD
ncbi:MAG TPA: hypothetical protein VHD34_08650 [Xanthobacteraceae bacterium]|nr:hypothetical protein [Xanthobacteraceae bacterium]